MKKTTVKKLALHKETLQRLHEELLTEAAAGAPGGTSLQYSRCESCGIIPCSNTCVPSNCG